MVLYIAKRGQYNIGAITHLRALREIYGEDSVLVIDLLNPNKEKSDLFISYGYNKYNPARIGRWLQGNVGFISNNIINNIIEIIGKNAVSLVFSEESDLGNLMSKIKSNFPNIKIICFYHDISADLFSQRKRRAPFWMIHQKIECDKTIKQEKKNVSFSDENWVFNEADAQRLRKYYGINPDAIIPLSCPAPTVDVYDCRVSKANEKKRILFICSMYNVNSIGFVWFYNNVFPKLSPNYEVLVVGTGSRGLREMGVDDERITLLGKVESLNNVYSDADIVIAPVFDGGGMKVKCLEAISYAKCIVSTSESLHGYWENLSDEIRNCVVFECDSAEEWIETLNDLDRKDIYKFNKKLFDVFVNRFEYEIMKKSFIDKLMS